MDKVATAASNQLNDIMLIKSKNRFMELSKELQDVALLREKIQKQVWKNRRNARAKT